jgi:hypothetical protein
MSNWRSRGHWSLAFGLFGMLPPYCGPHGPGGGGGAGSGNQSGEAGQAGSQAGSSTSGQAGAGAGAGGADAGGADAGGADAGGADAGGAPGDRVSESLLGCSESSADRTIPGAFELIPPYPGLPTPTEPWITDWSGDGQTAVGHYRWTPASDGSTEVFFLRWDTQTGYSMHRSVTIPAPGLRETPTSLASCDASVLALRFGNGSVFVTGYGDLPETAQVQYHDHLTLSEDGTTFSFLTGVREMTRPWTEWRRTDGTQITLVLDRIHSLSWDGLTTFGESECFTTSCPTRPAYFRWRPLLEARPDIDLRPRTPFVAADGESIVHVYEGQNIGIWRPDPTARETLACGGPCRVVAWSSHARVLLVQLESGYALWTRVHGFRPLNELLAVPSGWSITPTHLSLDGWTVAGTATRDSITQYFRATLRANAFE